MTEDDRCVALCAVAVALTLAGIFATFTASDATVQLVWIVASLISFPCTVTAVVWGIRIDNRRDRQEQT